MIRSPGFGSLLFVFMGCASVPTSTESVPSAPPERISPADPQESVTTTREEFDALSTEHESFRAYIHELEEANAMQLKIIDRLKSSKNCS